ncbi:MAG TPA: carboxypeptidase regulatory-like domain-containing protein, partial [Blastocatellia bacterium]|nr:carboxypeptidase regulatory-like domain-containing protein [Blastocatellia bacterium]
MTKKIVALALCLLIVQTALAMGPASALSSKFHNLISPSSAFSIQAGRVDGTVSDPTGAKVARARVRLTDASGAVVAEATTDNEGRFAFSDIAPGIYFLSVDADGFVLKDRLSVDVRAGQAKKIDLRLDVAAISEQVEVSSTDPIYSQLRQIKPSGEVATLKNVVLKRDAGTITFKDGQIFFLAPVEGRVTGAVFIGDGEFQITPPLDIEKRQISHLTGTGSMTEQFSKIVFRFTDKTYDELKKQATITQGQAASNAQEAFDEVKNKLRRGNFAYNLDGRILTDLTLPNPVGIFHAYFNGKKYGDWVFGVDPMGGPIVAPEEVFLINTTQGNFGIWGAFHINQHYRSPMVFDEDHRLFDIVHYNIDSTIKGKRLEATATAKIKTLVEGTRVLPLDLYRTIKISKVTDASGRDLKFVREEKNEDRDFFVIMPEPLKKGQEFELIFTYGGEEVVLDSGGGNYALNPGARANWYPNNAVTSFGDRSTFELTFRTAKGLVMVATGQPLEEKTEGDTTITRWKSDVALQVAGFNFGKFKKTVVQD